MERRDRRFLMVIGFQLRGFPKLKPVACNIGAGDSTERHFIYRTYLTEPQGKIKK